MKQWFTPSYWLTFVDNAMQWSIATLPSILFILLLAIIAQHLARALLRRVRSLMIGRMLSSDDVQSVETEKRLGTLLSILSSTVRVIIWAMAFMVLLRKLGVDIAPLIAGAGIAGLAIGFGAQEMVRDVISGFFMLLENQVRAGDVAVVNGTGGLVERVGLRTIILRDLTGTVHIFQNGKINSLSNMTKTWSAMVFNIGVAYKEDVDKVMLVMKRVADDMQAEPQYGHDILEPMEVFGLEEFGESAVVIRARLKTRPIQQWAIGREYRRRLKIAFDAEKIEIPFPHRTVYWGSESAPCTVAYSRPA